jgi:hypothetical protein
MFLECVVYMFARERYIYMFYKYDCVKVRYMNLNLLLICTFSVPYMNCLVLIMVNYCLDRYVSLRLAFS